MTLIEYADHWAKRSKVLWLDGIPWVLMDRILRPLPMPHQMTLGNRTEIRRAMKETGAVLAQWTEGWDTPPCGWWYLCCDDKEYDLTSFQRTARYKVRRGLDRCDVRHVDSGWFAENGYPVYAASFGHYGTKPLLTEAEFVQEFRRNGEYEGRETWGAFIDDKLVSYGSCTVIDDSVMLCSAKSDPASFKSRPNEALLYEMTRHYLRERRLSYISSGARVLFHETNYQDFQENLGYRKIHCLLRAELSSAAAVASALGLGRWGRRLGLRGPLGRFAGRLDALAAVASISRSCLPIGVSPQPATQTGGSAEV